MVPNILATAGGLAPALLKSCMLQLKIRQSARYVIRWRDPLSYDKATSENHLLYVQNMGIHHLKMCTAHAVRHQFVQVR